MKSEALAKRLERSAGITAFVNDLWKADQQPQTFRNLLGEDVEVPIDPEKATFNGLAKQIEEGGPAAGYRRATSGASTTEHKQVVNLGNGKELQKVVTVRRNSKGEARAVNEKGKVRFSAAAELQRLMQLPGALYGRGRAGRFDPEAGWLYDFILLAEESGKQAKVTGGISEEGIVKNLRLLVCDNGDWERAREELEQLREAIA